METSSNEDMPLPPRKKRVSLMDIAKHYIISGKDPEYLEKIYIDEVIGNGLVTKQRIYEGDFIVEYSGEHISWKDAEQRETEYAADRKGNFLYFFSQHCIDATNSERLGKWANDSPFPNAKMKLVPCNGKLHLCLFALANIDSNTEVRYNYDDDIENLWWRNQEKYSKYLRPINMNDWVKGYLSDESIQFDIVRSEKPSEVVKKMIKEGVFEVKDLAEDSEEEMSDSQQIEDILEDTITLNRSLSNDSGVAGDFPSVENTSIYDEDSEDENIDNPGSGSDDEYQPSNSESTEEEEVEEDEEVSKVAKKINSKVPNPLEVKRELEKLHMEVHQNEKEERSMSPDVFEGPSEPDEMSTPQRKVVGKKKQSEKKKDDTEQFEFPDEHEEDEPTIIIPRTSKTVDGHRVYDKKHFCLYCGKGDLKIARHLVSHHADEEAIKKLENMDVKDRKKQLDYLRFKGDYTRNMIVLKEGGELILWRRPQQGDVVRVTDYVPCQFCFAFVTQSELWRHHKSCQFIPSGGKGCVEDSKLLMYTHQVAEDNFPELHALVIDRMNNDDIKRIVSKDDIIRLYGAFHLENGGLKKLNTISDRMRVLARLLKEIRDVTKKPSLSLKEIICPEYFDTIIASTKALGGFSITSQEGEPIPSFSTPSIPLKVGYTISKCAELLRGNAIKISNEKVEEASERFLKLYTMEWSKRISSISLKTISTNKFQKVQYLPVTEDLLKVREHLKVGIRSYTEKLSTDVNLKNWRKLAEIVATRLTIFNRRRSSEVFNLLLSRYNEKHKWKDAQMNDIKESLSPLEQTLINRLNLVHVRGKRGRQVPILFNDDEKKAIDAVINYRSQVGISTENLYVFAAPKNTKASLRGNDTIRKVIAEIPELQYPERMKSTALRKYCATVSQIVDLDDNGMRWLADHLGHNLDVHREYYRLRDSTVELSKVSRLLLSIDEGNIKKFAGKKLSEITLEELPTLADENELEKEEEAPAEEQKVQRKRWSENEKAVVMDAFKDHMAGNKLPKKSECLKVILENEILKDRPWQNLKDFVRNNRDKDKKQ